MNKSLLAAFACLLSLQAWAQESPLPHTYIDTATGRVAGAATFVWNGSAWVASTGAGGGGSAGAVGAAGTNGTTAQSVQGINGGVPIATYPGPLTIVPLTVATVTTGGTAVTTLTAGQRTKGGFLLNPKGATIDLCINEQGSAASGTTSASGLICVAPGNSFNLAPSALSVSVVTSDSAHPFAGEGYN